MPLVIFEVAPGLLWACMSKRPIMTRTWSLMPPSKLKEPFTLPKKALYKGECRSKLAFHGSECSKFIIKMMTVDTNYKTSTAVLIDV